MPKFKVWWPERGQEQDDARVFGGVDHEHAAKRWADWYDSYSNDYPIVSGETAVVQVLHEGDIAPVTVIVRGYPSREYTAAV